MYKWLSLVFGVVGIALIVAYNVLDEVGIPKADQRPVRIAFITVLVAWTVVWVGHRIVRHRASVNPDPPEASSDKNGD